MEDKNLLLDKLEQDEDFIYLQNYKKAINIFDILKVSNMEIRHSNVLAWLFDPKETHGLGDAVLKAFFVKCNIDVKVEDLHNICVWREFEHTDLLIYSDELIVCIENKVYSTQGDDQLQKYKEFIENYFSKRKFVFLYLTLSGEEPNDKQWEIITYKDHILSAIQTAIKGKTLIPQAELIINDYIKVVKEKSMGNEDLKSRCIKLYFTHKQAFDIINANLPNGCEFLKDVICNWCNSHKDEIIYDGKHNDGNYRWIRFRTDFLNEFFPTLKGDKKSGGWEYEDYIYYEITNTHIDKLYIDLVIDTYNLGNLLSADEFAEIEKIVKAISNKSIKGRGYLHIKTFPIDFTYTRENEYELSSGLDEALKNIKAVENQFKIKIKQKEKGVNL